MEKLYTLLPKALLLALPLTVQAQMDFYQADPFGSRFNDINDHGLAVSGGAYFDFPTRTWTFMEAVAVELVSLNNGGDVAGAMYLDEPNFILQPGVRKNGVWQPIGWFPAANPEESSFSTYGISPNGRWVTGQMSIGCCDFGTFLYNTETEVLTPIFHDDYVAVAGYCVADDGTVGGWADDEGTGSTRRIPVYITPALVIVPVASTMPEEMTNAVNAINASAIMVGDFDNRPFLFNPTTATFTTFDIPAGYMNATFTSISDNGIAVGYAQNFGDFGSLIRETIIYHPELGAQPVFLKDILLAHGVDINAASGRMGTAMAISPNGKYVAGWDDQAPFAANGWVAFLDDLLLGTGVEEKQAFTLSVMPNPAKDMLRITAEQEVGAVTVFNTSGQVVLQRSFPTNSAVLDMAGLAPGLYMLRATGRNGSAVVRVVKE